MTRSNADARSAGQSPQEKSGVEKVATAVTMAFAAAAAVFGHAGSARAATGTLLVYLHVPVKQRAFQSSLGLGLPGVATTAVGRIADFERALLKAPDAVLTLPVVLGAKGIAPSLRGAMHGLTEERYALLGTGAAPSAARVVSVGALDILGREGTNSFVRSLVNSRVHVERVTKFEDLLPLLQMQRVETVLLPARLLPELRAASRLPLAARELEEAVGLPAAAGTGPNGPSVLNALSRMPADLSKLLGVDEWR